MGVEPENDIESGVNENVQIQVLHICMKKSNLFVEKLVAYLFCLYKIDFLLVFHDII